MLALGAFGSGAASAVADEHAGHQGSGHQNVVATQNPADAAKAKEKKVSDALSKLSPEDRKLAEEQRFCPAMEHTRLGEMGPPIKVLVEGKPVLVCCKGCKPESPEQAKEFLAKAKDLTEATAALAKLSPEDRAVAESQKYCAVMNDSLLGSMGTPLKIMLEGKPVFLCCKGCIKKAQAKPSATLAKVEELQKAGRQEDHAGHAAPGGDSRHTPVGE